MNHESRKTRYRRRKPLIGYILFVAAIGGIGLAFYLSVQKNFFKEQKEDEIAQTRWLYWCAGIPEEAHDRLCYYVNSDGIVVDEAPRLRGNLFPKLYDERTTTPLYQEREWGGKKILEESLLAFVNQFYQFGQFVVKNDETLEIGWPDAMQIKTTLKDDPKKVAENLALILEKEIGDRRDEVDYIDLRFGNRVYYKFR